MCQDHRACDRAHECDRNPVFSLTVGCCRMMALINNWDLKHENNAVYEEKHGDSGAPELHYAVK